MRKYGRIYFIRRARDFMGNTQVYGRDIAKGLHSPVLRHDRRAADSGSVSVGEAYKSARRGGRIRMDGIAAHAREARLKLRRGRRKRARRKDRAGSAAFINEQRAAARDYNNGSRDTQANFIRALFDAAVDPEQSGAKPIIEKIHRAVK